MRASRVVLSLITLLLLQFVAGVLMSTAIGREDEKIFVWVSPVVNFIIAASIFCYMSWSVSGKPYVAAFVVGIAAELIGRVLTILVIGTVIWHPIVIVIELSLLVTAILVGIEVGESLRKKGASR